VDCTVASIAGFKRTLFRRRLFRRRLATVCALVALTSFGAVVLPSGARAEISGDCISEDLSRRVDACSALIDSSQLSEADLALAYSARALAYSVQGRYEQAISDYNASLKLDPGSAVALNNRAWAYVRSGTPERGATDVEKALALDPDSPHTLDTRAHIYQSRGDVTAAMQDYENAMRFGGQHIVKLYQCGLQAHSFYDGEIDGLFTSTLRRALEACVATTGCDPLPADEECRKITS
jgi:tetratricopeptide (TPR) repeat protein